MTKEIKYYRKYDPDDPWDMYLASLDFNTLPEPLLKKIQEAAEEKKAREARERKERRRRLGWI